MSDSLSTNQLRLEVLPDELFLEIFQYVDPIDLYNIKGLNKRIDSIIKAVKVNIVVEEQEYYDLDYISSFAPTQIIRLEMYSSTPSLNLHEMTELRSLTLNCNYLWQEQSEQIAKIVKISLPRLERLVIDNVTHDLHEPLFDAIFQGEQFPSLTICRLSLTHHYNLKFNKKQLSSTNNTLHCLIIDKWNYFNLDFLLHQLPHLRRFETNFEESCISMIDLVTPHLAIKNLRVTLNDPLYDFEKLLKLTPNLARLRVRGNLGRNSVLNYFQKVAEFLPTLLPLLQCFDCELYCYPFESRESESIIRQLHTFFRKIRCLSGRGRNQCHTTDLELYPFNNKYEESSPRSSFMQPSSTHYYYSDESDDVRYDHDYDEDDEAWVRNEYGNGPNMYWDAESDEWCPLP
ncbi:hypothetical protein I4U23_016956 [Adineta vaga]|nr:hypothetical protein I4U23_016956 [Adineta vaga]